jgi:hypothetical protein
MATWVRARHYCINVAGGCRHAIADRPFSDEEHRRHQGRCKDDEGGGCGAPLVAGDPIDLRARRGGLVLAATLGIAGGGWGLARVLFPPPVTGVAFAATQSQTTDTVGMLTVEVLRPAGATRPTTVEYSTVDGTALAGQDYSAVRGSLHFAAGELRKTITVPLVPDASFSKGPRDFRLVLLNVEGRPLHIVRVEPQQLARSEALVVEQAVRMASVLAKDIADLVVRRRMLDLAMLASRERPGEFAEYRNSLATVTGNLTRARESYVQSLRDLQAQQSHAVLGAMGRVATDLQQRRFEQQAQAVTVMRKHYTELLQRQRPDMDRWAEELSEVIPKVGAPARPVPST